MKSTLRNMTLSLTGLALAVAAVLGTVHMLTERPIAEAAVKARNDAMVEILPPFDNDIAATAAEVESITVYTARKGDTAVGYAAETYSDNGFGGRITVLVGFAADGSLTGYRVMSHAETPGLGAKMGEWFCQKGTNHDIIGTTAPVSVTKDGGSIDAITGATITSRAFSEAINRARAVIFNNDRL